MCTDSLCRGTGGYGRAIPIKPEWRSHCWWWLRSPGSNQDEAAGVYVDGSVGEYGRNVNHVHGAVRPAMWITIDG